MKKFKLWDACFCLCLDKRKEHWQKLIEEGKSISLEIRPYVCGDGSHKDLKYDQIDVLEKDIDLSGWGYSAPGRQINHYNALLAHRNIILNAKNEGIKSLLLLEDDAKFLFSRFEYIIDKVEQNEEWVRFCEKFHLLYLGFWKGNELDDENRAIEENWKTHKAISLIPIKPGEGIGGLHGVIIRKEVFYSFLSHE